jgi:hypothetical protein
MVAIITASPPVVVRGDFARCAVPQAVNNGLEVRGNYNRRSATGLWFGPEVSLPSELAHPPFDGCLANLESPREPNIPGFASFVRFDNTLPEFNGMGLGHCQYRSKLAPGRNHDRLS